LPDTPEPSRWQARVIPPVHDGDRVMLTDEAIASLVGQTFAVGTITEAHRDAEGWVVLTCESAVAPPVDTRADDYSLVGVGVGANVDRLLVEPNPAYPRVLTSLDVFEVSFVAHPPHPGSVVLSPENPVCTCGVTYAAIEEKP
jgi:hypothetical protein